MIVKFRLRRDTAANWTSVNPVLALGEPGVETDTRKLKFGDGVTAWADLDYLVGDLLVAADIPFTPAGGIAATNLQAALAELDSEKASYSFGTFTPTLRFGGNSVGILYTDQLGEWSRIGRLVVVDIRILLSGAAGAKGTSTGAASIGGLPFTSAANPQSSGAFTASGLASVASSPLYVVGASGTAITLLSWNGSSANASMTEANFTDSSFIRLTAIYRAA